MKFEKDLMYKNIFKDKNMAFIVDEVLSQNSHRGTDLIVTWYQQTADGRYVSIGINGEFHVSKDSVMHYVEI